jgi:hypothetical protein
MGDTPFAACVTNDPHDGLDPPSLRGWSRGGCNIEQPSPDRDRPRPKRRMQGDSDSSFRAGEADGRPGQYSSR